MWEISGLIQKVVEFRSKMIKSYPVLCFSWFMGLESSCHVPSFILYIKLLRHTQWVPDNAPITWATPWIFSSSSVSGRAGSSCWELASRECDNRRNTSGSWTASEATHTPGLPSAHRYTSTRDSPPLVTQVNEHLLLCMFDDYVKMGYPTGCPCPDKWPLFL